MAIEVIDIGIVPNDNTGETLREAFDKVNGNFAQLSTGAGLYSLNGLIISSQTFAVADSGTDLAVTSVIDVHTISIPTQDGTKGRGLLTNNDWNEFNSKFSSTGGTISGSITIDNEGSVIFQGADGAEFNWDGTGSLTLTGVVMEMLTGSSLQFPGTSTWRKIVGAGVGNIAVSDIDGYMSWTPTLAKSKVSTTGTWAAADLPAILNTTTFPNIILNQSTVAYASTIVFDFDGPAYQIVTLTGPLTLAGVHMGTGKAITIELVGDSSDRALTYDASWVIFGTAITTCTANKRVIITLQSNSTTAASVRGIAVAQV